MEKPKVLVADDEQVIRNLFERYLGAQGYEVSTAQDGLEAITKIRNNNYDILMLDLKMPRLQGMAVLKKLERLKKDLTIIVVTGYATVDTAKEAIKLGCFDYVTKPFDIEDVGIIIKRAFQMRRLVIEKKKLQEQIQATEKLAALAQMGAGVAHEVNTVLASVKLFLEMLKSKSALGKTGKNTGLILEEVIRAEQLITRFLKFTKPAEIEFLKTDINLVLERSLEFLEYRLSKQKIEVSKQLSPKLPKVSCDPSRIEEVFLNIFSNSIDAMVEGGTLTITSQPAGKNIAVIICDTGEGISSENLPKLYNPFFTTKVHGTGLGLSIVHRIIDEHKGRIEISSPQHKGTSVRIELPIDSNRREKNG